MPASSAARSVSDISGNTLLKNLNAGAVSNGLRSEATLSTAAMPAKMNQNSSNQPQATSPKIDSTSSNAPITAVDVASEVLR